MAQAQPVETLGVRSLPELIQIPLTPSTIPPGLEFLTELAGVLIIQDEYQRDEWKILDQNGQELLSVEEESSCCSKTLGGGQRAFVMAIRDAMGQEVMHLTRPERFSCCQIISVQAPVGHLVGQVKLEWLSWKPSFKILNEAGELVLKVRGKGSCLSVNCCADKKFKIVSQDELGVREVGQIADKMEESFPCHYDYGITFPLDLDVRMKGALIGAAFLIHFMYYEDQKHPSKGRDRLGGFALAD